MKEVSFSDRPCHKGYPDHFSLSTTRLLEQFDKSRIWFVTKERLRELVDTGKILDPIREFSIKDYDFKAYELKLAAARAITINLDYFSKYTYYK